jgi:hypothetical protein
MPMGSQLRRGARSPGAGGTTQAGIEITRQQDVEKAKAIEGWLDSVAQSYGVISADAAIFRRWAQLIHRRSDQHLEDALIAATALVRGLTVGLLAMWMIFSLSAFPSSIHYDRHIRRSTPSRRYR